MKRLSFLIAALLLPLAAFAQDRIPLLDKVPGHRVSFYYTYTIVKEGSPSQEVTSGEVTLEGNAYRATGLGLEILCDGVTRWTREEAAREVLVETVQPDDAYANPAQLVASYRHFRDQITVHASGPDSLDVSLAMDEDTAVRFVLTGVTFLPEQGQSEFSLDVSALPSDYIVTDLR